MITLIYFLLILGVIVLIHEFGHFIFAKMFDVYVYEFSIGMGPKLFSYKKEGSETEYSLRAIPLGGFVAMAGEDDDEEEIPDDRKLLNKSATQRLIVMAAGAVFNFISAFIILFMIASIWGSVNTKPIIMELTEDMPAYSSGLEANDLVVSVNDKKVSVIDDVSLYVQLEGENPVKVVVDRNNELLEFNIQPELVEINKEKVYLLGIAFSNKVEKGFVTSIKYTFVKMNAIFRQMYTTLTKLFTGGIKVKQLSGPVGIYNIVDNQKSGGIQNLLYLVVLLSINVGVINLLPFPALDGSKILFVFIEKIKGSPVDIETESLVHLIGFILLIFLMVFVTFNDIIKLF